MKSTYFKIKTASLHGMLIAIIIMISACKKFVTVDLPVTELATPSVFADKNSATSAQLAIYLNMVNHTESYNMAKDLGLLSDELANYSNSSFQIEFFQNALNPNTLSASHTFWAGAYGYIYSANSIIENLQQSTTISNSAKNQLTGESKFIRAFWHFYLTSCFGDVPLVTTTNYTINGTISRSSKATVMAQVISDLKDAQTLLSSNYVDVNDTANSAAERVRPIKSAATALLARAYLYTGKYSDAETQASAVINNPLFSILPDLNTVFLANSNEAIWQLQTPQPALVNGTQDGYYFILTAQPRDVSIGNYLLQAFEPGDLRRTNWIHDTTIVGKSYSYPFKYKIGRFASSNSEYVMVLRLAEQYLIRAEAEANLNDLSDAAADLNVIRKRAGLPDISPGIAASKDLMLAAILHERQVELFTEWGHRWLDLVRTQNVNTVMSTVTPTKGGTWNSDGHQALFPIPQDQRLLDQNLSQNPGY